ncbi:MAG: RNA pseudouridine synthase [Deltaproteobacteria bacterium]|nr:RNA pseudouridine synthase [Deltaproteobacteria bacterium]
MTTKAERPEKSPLRNLLILHEDASHLAVSKPAGMAVHGGAGEDEVNVIDLLRSARPSWSDLHLVHRLDKGTSGVLLLAKSAHVARELADGWSEVTKEYLALSAGSLTQRTATSARLARRDGRQQDARTEVEPLSALPDFTPVSTLIRARISTGRHHQIRRHLAQLGYPILMDRQHGDFSANREWAESVRAAVGVKPKHPMLHALRLSIPRRRAGKQGLDIRAPCPEAWIRILEAGGGGDALSLHAL